MLARRGEGAEGFINLLWIIATRGPRPLDITVGYGINKIPRVVLKQTVIYKSVKIAAIVEAISLWLN